jgi:hypothetical protein
MKFAVVTKLLIICWTLLNDSGNSVIAGVKGALPRNG